MADITKCKGNNCPLKEFCYRFKVEDSTYQSYFVTEPYNEDAEDCEYFWEDTEKKE